MINCVLGLVADADEAVQEGTQKVLEGMTKAVTDPANAEKATHVNVSGFNTTLLWGIGSVLAMISVFIFGCIILKKNNLSEKFRKILVIIDLVLFVLGVIVLFCVKQYTN